jgi:uncharacterized protein YbjT (DUF2867 family)
MSLPSHVFVAGATGYLARTLIPTLVERGHVVRGLVRPGSERKLPRSCAPISGNALDHRSYTAHVTPCDTFVHLVGTPHPAPWKGAQFRAVDLVSLRESVQAAVQARVRHFVFVSVAHPAPVMKSYVEVRSECEAILTASGLPATILRPWYVIGPAHRWPLLLVPVYRIAESIPSMREGALRLGLVTWQQMRDALVWAVEHPGRGTQILDVPRIRAARPEDAYPASAANASASLTGHSPR